MDTGELGRAWNPRPREPRGRIHASERLWIGVAISSHPRNDLFHIPEALRRGKVDGSSPVTSIVPSNALKEVRMAEVLYIVTDGSAIGNPGPSGWVTYPHSPHGNLT